VVVVVLQKTVVLTLLRVQLAVALVVALVILVILEVARQDKETMVDKVQPLAMYMVLEVVVVHQRLVETGLVPLPEMAALEQHLH
jgi:hypothetical protein